MSSQLKSQSDKTIAEHDAHASEKAASAPTQPVIEYPTMKRMFTIMLALFCSIFLVSLDRTILSTAIPTITDQFHSLGDVGWYGSAYLLTTCGFQLVYGRIYTFYDPKKVFLLSITLFEIGSAICGAAPSSTVFIVGRGVAGLGGCGIMSGAIVIMTHTVPLSKRPIFMGCFGAMFGIASVIGPLLGGAFTTRISWRWCFYINLPIGAVSILVVLLVLQLPAPTNANLSYRDRLWRLDPIGTLFFLPAIVCLLLALQWGGSVYPWNSGRIITLLVIMVFFLAIFIIVQTWREEMATIPPRIISQRSIAAGFWYALFSGASQMSVIYFLPIYFQAIKGSTPIESGIQILPMIFATVVASITAGIATQKLGYYVPFMLAASILLPIGAGLLTTLTIDSTTAQWIGYQIFFGFGLGLGMQQAGLAAQTVLARKDVAAGASLIFLAQALGGAVFVSVGESVFINHLASGLAKSGFDSTTVVSTGATDLRSVFGDNISNLLPIYDTALSNAFFVAVGTSCCLVFGALCMEWKSVKHAIAAQKATAKGA